MRKIKILHISPDSVIHGTERHILSILKYSDRNNFEHAVVMPDEGNLKEELKCVLILQNRLRLLALHLPTTVF